MGPKVKRLHSFTVTDEATARTLRAFILLLVGGGTIAVFVDLMLLSHYKDSNQLIPLTVAAAGLVSTAWAAVSPRNAAIRALQFLMLCFVGTGVIGITLHIKGGIAHQGELDPSLAGRALFWKVVAAPDPPVLSPGIMVELGLLGLVYTYRHPALREEGR
jgi:hypothetical protein